MGESAFVNSEIPAKSAARPRSLRLPVDVPLLLAVSTLVVVGLLFLYSASWQFSIRKNLGPEYLLVRQLAWVALGCVGALVASRLNYHYYPRFIVPAIGLTLLALLAVVILHGGNTEEGRGLLGQSGQPSEIAKLVIILYLAVWLNAKRGQLNEVRMGLLPLFAILGINAGLIFLQPDFSAALSIVILGVILFTLAEGDWRQVVLVGLATIILGALVVFISGRGLSRLQEYWAGLLQPLNANYHVRRSMQAITEGGLFGVGIGRGQVKLYNLPTAWTDSVFAVIVEETGLFGALTIIALFMVVLWRGLGIAKRAPDPLGRLIAGGISLWIAFEMLLNVGALVNVLPFAGNALPFVSYGGSSILTTLTAMGILMNIARQSKPGSESSDGRSFGAVINLRRRDRRRRVSRSVGLAGNRE